MGNFEIMQVHKRSKDKVKQVSEMTGLHYSKTFGVFSDSIPRIMHSEIIRKPRSKQKKIRITFEQEFYLP